MISYRYSRESDAEELQALFDLAFGKLDGSQTEHLYHRYLLATNESGVIVAASGLSETDYYDGLEIDWTCTHPAFQQQGIMKELFRRLLDTTDQRVYCSCWVTCEENCHLGRLMEYFGFYKIITQRLKCTYPVCCQEVRHSTCPYTTGMYCSCTEDLYVRDKSVAKD